MMRDIIAVARGEAPADLVLRGARVVNVFSGEAVRADVAIKDGVVAGLGEYAAGKSEADMEAAVRAVGEMHGGLAVAADGKVLAALPLPVGGVREEKAAAAENYRRSIGLERQGCGGRDAG